jgi:aldose 1-epimerase
MKKAILIMSFLFLSLTTLGQKNTHTSITLLNKSDFETEIDGKQVQLYTLKNHSGMISEITNYGGKVVSLWTSNRKGHYEDIVLGYSNIKDYLKSKEKYFGALIGRYGNRIADGKFALNAKEYDLAQNNGPNHLHGGNKGLESVVWDAKQVDGQTLELRYISKNMEEGYPGNLNIKVVYKLTNNNELKIEYWASTDEPTIINLTHHSFFNLKGAGNGAINNHLLQINAAYYTPVDNGLIPTGEIASVENSPFDFQKMIEIGQRVDAENQQLKYGLGYDHNFVLNQKLEGLNYAAKVVEPVSGRTMEVYTNEPGLQFYGGNFLNGTEIGKNNKAYDYRTAFCLETQHFPDSPNKNNFPTTKLNPGEKYYSICIYKFFISKQCEILN